MVGCGDLEGLRLGVGRHDSFAQPGDHGGFILGAEDPEATVFANLSALVALSSLAPLPLGVRLGRHACLTGEMRNDAAGNALAAIREAPIELEGFEQNGETEPSGTRLVGEQFAFVRGKRPVLGEFVGVPILLHGPPSRTSIVRRRSITLTSWAYSGSWPR